jgi:triphosphoribosyl-dephospho-CoA synthetase
MADDNYAALAQRARQMQQQAAQSLQRGTRSMGQGLGRLLGPAVIASMKRGGRVHKTGIYRLHRGERVVPKRRGRR